MRFAAGCVLCNRLSTAEARLTGCWLAELFHSYLALPITSEPSGSQPSGSTLNSHSRDGFTTPSRHGAWDMSLHGMSLHGIAATPSRHVSTVSGQHSGADNGTHYRSALSRTREKFLGEHQQQVVGLLILYAAHEETPIRVEAYCRRASNPSLFALLDHAVALIHGAFSWDATMVEYQKAVAAQSYDLHARVRKLWCKLRIVVLCGWIRSARRPPPLPTTQEIFVAKARAYLQKFKGAGAKPPARADMVAGMWTFLGVFTSILILSAIHEHGFGQAEDIPYVIMSGSFGALATLLFAAPASPFAQPKMVVLGHILSITVAILVDYLVMGNMLSAWVAVALVPALAISGMAVTGCINPPAAAAALIYASGTAKVKAFGWMFLCLPNLVGVIIMMLVAILVNNLSSKRKYPQFWW